jgi:hypothetical protein
MAIKLGTRTAKWPYSSHKALTSYTTGNLLESMVLLPSIKAGGGPSATCTLARLNDRPTILWQHVTCTNHASHALSGPQAAESLLLSPVAIDCNHPEIVR